jgi:glutathione S-transferase
MHAVGLAAQSPWSLVEEALQLARARAREGLDETRYHDPDRRLHPRALPALPIRFPRSLSAPATAAILVYWHLLCQYASMPRLPQYRLFSWEHSYFSGKVRAFLRYKAHGGALAYEDVLATPELIQGVLLPATGTNVVPQLLAPDGAWVQDSSEILDFCERAHATPRVIPSAREAPKQCIASFLIELLADEWMVVYAFFERWFHGRDGADPSHAGFNEQQWGAVLAAGADGHLRRRAGRAFLEGVLGVREGFAQPRGVYAGLVAMGVTPETIPAWESSHVRLLGRLEEHFARHDFVLGGLPSLGDFSLLGPLYAHHYRDAVAGFALRTRFPLVTEWVERTNHEGAHNARSYGQKLYTRAADGTLVGRPATSDGGAWLPGDEIPPTLLPVLEVFFEEMWPVLKSTLVALRAFLESGAHPSGGELPGKTFTPSPGFEALQTCDGALTHDFTIGGVSARRMVLPYHVWMLQRIADALRAATVTPAGRTQVEALLAPLPGGLELLALDHALAGCRVRKSGGRLFAAPTASA